jgi:hypothetical protein
LTFVATKLGKSDRLYLRPHNRKKESSPDLWFFGYSTFGVPWVFGSLGLSSLVIRHCPGLTRMPPPPISAERATGGRREGLFWD